MDLWGWHRLSFILIDGNPSKLVNKSLDRSGAMDVQRYVHDLGHHAVNYDSEGWSVWNFDYLLAQVIAKLVAHNIS